MNIRSAICRFVSPPATSSTAVIARHGADLLGRAEAEADGSSPMARQLGRMDLEDLAPGLLEQAFVAYAVGHSPGSTRRVLFCRQDA